MLNQEKRDFIAWYRMMYDASKKKAEDAYSRAKKAHEDIYIQEMIDFFKQNAKKSFYED